MQEMIFKRLIMKCLLKKNVQFLRTCSSQNKKSSNQAMETNSNDFCPQDIYSKFFEKKKMSNTMYFLNEEGAKLYASIIIKELLKNDIPVIEMQPGLGFLTRILLDAGISEIYLYEPNEKLIEVLKKMLKNYSQRIHIRKYNLLQLNKVALLDFMNNEETLEKIFNGIKSTNDSSKPSFQIVGPMSNIQLPMFLTSVDQKFFFKYQHVVLYVATLPSVSKIFDDIPGNHLHRPKNIYLRVRFKYKALGEMPQKYIYPIPQKKKNKGSHSKNDSEKMHIIKLESNRDGIKQKFTTVDWCQFFHFLRMGMKNRHTRVIPTLETWIPDCGPKLIQHDFNIYSTFSELTSTELFHLFNIFRAIPGYESSSFMSILHSGMRNYPEVYTVN